MYFFCWGTYLFISVNRNSLSIKDITFYLKFVLHSFSSSNLSFTFKVPLEVELLNILCSNISTLSFMVYAFVDVLAILPRLFDKELL